MHHRKDTACGLRGSPQPAPQQPSLLPTRAELRQISRVVPREGTDVQGEGLQAQRNTNEAPVERSLRPSRHHLARAAVGGVGHRGVPLTVCGEDGEASGRKRRPGVFRKREGAARRGHRAARRRLSRAAAPAGGGRLAETVSTGRKNHISKTLRHCSVPEITGTAAPLRGKYVVRVWPVRFSWRPGPRWCACGRGWTPRWPLEGPPLCPLHVSEQLRRPLGAAAVVCPGSPGPRESACGSDCSLTPPHAPSRSRGSPTPPHAPGAPSRSRRSLTLPHAPGAPRAPRTLGGAASPCPGRPGSPPHLVLPQPACLQLPRASLLRRPGLLSTRARAHSRAPRPSALRSGLPTSRSSIWGCLHTVPQRLRSRVQRVRSRPDARQGRLPPGPLPTNAARRALASPPLPHTRPRPPRRPPPVLEWAQAARVSPGSAAQPPENLPSPPLADQRRRACSGWPECLVSAHLPEKRPAPQVPGKAAHGSPGRPHTSLSPCGVSALHERKSLSVGTQSPCAG
ncbi:PREDICTED: vegetative cell wall protein gp1-like [Chinchilla lanigera]|uniref:vegetative cell wall protein gp1-like n=1 Tax=Chinchilla lanigera TaxID=34839 RepID=UPI000696F0C4|nr:PREDICTED: vegetative cell wall protein gp1-like [Chinchilla lanigera]